MIDPKDLYKLAEAKGIDLRMSFLNRFVFPNEELLTGVGVDAAELAAHLSDLYSYTYIHKMLRVFHGLHLVCSPYPAATDRPIYYYNCFSERIKGWIIKNPRSHLIFKWEHDEAMLEGLYDVLLNHVK